MPLTSLTTCYKTLPSYFADKVTQQMRKRRECYVTPDKQDDEVEVRDGRFDTPLSSSRRDPAPRTADAVLMTKRSCTPLGAVSDNESDDGSTSRDVGGRQSTSRDVGGRASALSYVTRQRRSPRTAVSLDNVDLWEDDDSDVDDKRTTPRFDVVNGVAINPRSTIDFAELRRSRSPVASKRNRPNDDPDGRTSLRQAADAARIRADMASARERLLEDGRCKPRIRTIAAGLLFPRPRGTGPDAPSKHRNGRDAGLDPVRSPIEKQRGSESKFQMPPLSRTYTITESSSAGVTCANTPPTDRMLSAVKVNELNRVNRKLGAFTPTGAQGDPPTQGSRDVRAIASVKDDLKRARDPDTRLPATRRLSSGTSPDRKVKFNNFVAVREGDINAYECLKRSQNSAQTLKQKYLGHGGNVNMSRAPPGRQRFEECAKRSPPVEITL